MTNIRRSGGHHVPIALSALCAWGTVALAQEAPRTAEPPLAGQWVGESISDQRGIQRWSVDRRADGTYTAHLLSVGREGAKESDVEGRWQVKGGVLHMDPALDSALAGAWRYEAQQSDCLRLEAADPASGKVLKPSMRFGECRTLVRWPVPEKIHQTCVIDKPMAPARTELDLRIEQEADGNRYAKAGGDRNPTPVEVRDYTVLRDFEPRKPDTLTNAAEAFLTLVQGSVDRDPAFARTLGFKPSDVRSARIYVLAPPRPRRPMEYYTAGSNSLLEARDSNGKPLGMAMYTPFIIACPPAAEN